MCCFILVCYKLWGFGFLNFFQVLEDINRFWEFQEVILGFFVVLFFIQECVFGVSSFKFKNLVQIYLVRNMSECSVMVVVLVMCDLCCFIEVFLGFQLVQYIYFFSNLQCFVFLQFLVQVVVLFWVEVCFLVLYNVSFMELLSVYCCDWKGGLKKYSCYLSLQIIVLFFVQFVVNLQVLGIYFEGLLEGLVLVQVEGVCIFFVGYGLVERVFQQS